MVLLQKEKKWFCCIFRCGAENNNRKIRWRHSTDGSRDAAGWTIMFEVISHFSSNYKSKSSWLRSSRGEVVELRNWGRILKNHRSPSLGSQPELFPPKGSADFGIFSEFLTLYSSPPINLKLCTFFNLGRINLPRMSETSISKSWICISLMWTSRSTSYLVLSASTHFS